MIWVTAALGMGIGAGYEWVSAIACVSILLMLFFFGYLEKYIDKLNQVRNYRIETDFKNDTMQRFEKCFEAHHLRYQRGREIKDGSSMSGEWFVRGSQKNHLAFIGEILQDPQVKRFEY